MKIQMEYKPAIKAALNGFEQLYRRMHTVKYNPKDKVNNTEKKKSF